MGEVAEGNWCLIESDPGVFSELIKEFGVEGVQVEELWSLDAEHFERLKPVHGLIFLFKWVGNSVVSNTGKIVPDDGEIFFARQVIQNACSTQAIISVLMNCSHPDVKFFYVLSEMKDFTSDFDPSMKGLALSNSDTIRSVHNSFARQTLFEFDNKTSSGKDDVYHFVGYIPTKNGRVFELDGLKDGPIDHGAIPEGKDWVETVRPILMDRINKYGEKEIHFNLLAVVSDRKVQFEKKIIELEKSGKATPESILELKQLIEDEESKRKRFKLENIRRKHNYLPLIVQFLKELAQQKQLLPLFEKAKEKAKTAAESKKSSKS